MTADSALTMDMAKRVAIAYAIVDSFSKAHPGAITRRGADSLHLTPSEHGESWIRNDQTQIERNPALVDRLKAAGFTPATYAHAYVRILFAWNICNVQKMLAAQGILPQVVGLPTLPTGDADFINQHEAELKKLGFPEPPQPSMQSTDDGG